jgi:hypothetical protein
MFATQASRPWLLPRLVDDSGNVDGLSEWGCRALTENGAHNASEDAHDISSCYL